ncbi:hypothetical protein Q604_UNBC09799G0003 [human gut metagenome]|uniref:Glycosyltransferase n=1 Tax=human gut metagenome TaxID=408170 RepID=W1Y038_9ZZZZ
MNYNKYQKYKDIIFLAKCKIANKILINYYKSTMNNCKNMIKNSNNKVIISLTTIPSRIDTVWITIESLLRQSYKPDRIILWLGKELFQNIALPKELLLQKKRGLEIYYCKDLICHTKYYYTLKENPESNIITVDDDIIYYKNMIKELIDVGKRYPKNIVCHRAHEILLDSNYNIKKYKEWNWEGKKVQGPSNRLLQTGVSGVLYPPHSLNNEVLNKDKFMRLCPKADDVWLKVMAIINGTKIVKVRKKSMHYPIIYNTQKIALSIKNIEENGNDIQIKNLFEEYNINSKLLI